MAILIWFAVLLLASLIAAGLLRHADRARAAATSKQQTPESVSASTPLQPASKAGTPATAYEPPNDGATPQRRGHIELTWTALDDLQLTRLLTEAARRDDPE